MPSLRQGVAEHFGLPAALQGVELLCLLNDGEGGVLVGSDGKGLLRIVDGVVQQVTVKHGLADDHIYGLTNDRQGRLWMSSPDGVSYVHASHLVETLNGRRESFHSVMWGREEGITGEPIRAFPKSAATLSDGTLAFPALDGLIQIDPALIRTPLPPVVALDEIDLGAEGNGHGTLEIKRLRTDASALRFSFSAPKHPRPHRLKFRFRLLGLDTAWRVGTGTGEARYVGVDPGTYHFEVQALAEKEDGGPSAVVSATVLILPPWYRTWQFTVLALALVVATLYSLDRQRTARAAKLLDAKAAERRRIAADIHDGLSQDLVGLRLQLEAAQASLQKDPTSAQKFLHRTGLLLEDGLKDLRDCIWGLTHDEVDTDALGNGLRDRLLRSTQDSAVSLQFENLSERCSIAPGAAWQISQIAREAVANAIKHAAAKNIAVSLRTVANSIILAVEDDGLGMANDGANPGVGRGFGMSGMKARAETLGATLAFLHNPLGGTRVELSVPRTGASYRRFGSKVQVYLRPLPAN